MLSFHQSAYESDAVSILLRSRKARSRGLPTNKERSHDQNGTFAVNCCYQAIALIVPMMSAMAMFQQPNHLQDELQTFTLRRN